MWLYVGFVVVVVLMFVVVWLNCCVGVVVVFVMFGVVWFVFGMIGGIGYDEFGCYSLGVLFVLVVCVELMKLLFDMLFYLIEMFDYMFLFYMGYMMIMV